MKLNREEEQIIQLIGKLPKVTDDRTKKEVLQAISTEQANQGEQKRDLKTFVPIISGFMIAIVLLFVFINANDRSNFVTEEDSSSESFDQSVTMYESREESNESIVIDVEEALFNDLAALQLDYSLSFEFSIETKDDQLSFIFKDGTIGENNQKYEEMIESILLVAKSYGFHSVHFKNLQIEQIGPYDLSEAISVD